MCHSLCCFKQLPQEGAATAQDCALQSQLSTAGSVICHLLGLLLFVRTTLACNVSNILLPVFQVFSCLFCPLLLVICQTLTTCCIILHLCVGTVFVFTFILLQRTRLVASFMSLLVISSMSHSPHSLWDVIYSRAKINSTGYKCIFIIFIFVI